MQTAMLAPKQGNGVSIRAITEFFYAAVLFNIELKLHAEVHLCGSPSYLLIIFHKLSSFSELELDGL